MTTQLTTKGSGRIALISLISICCGATLTVAQAQEQIPAKHRVQYQVSTLPDFGGTSSGGNSINDHSWVAGYSRLPDRNRHATLWRSSLLSDLNTLGGPNSSVTWNVKNTQGVIKSWDGRRTAFMTLRVAAPKSSSFAQPCGLWDRQTRSMTSL